jgi:hypothetical protein
VEESEGGGGANLTVSVGQGKVGYSDRAPYDDLGLPLRQSMQDAENITFAIFVFLSQTR